MKYKYLVHSRGYDGELYSEQIHSDFSLVNLLLKGMELDKDELHPTREILMLEQY